MKTDFDEVINFAAGRDITIERVRIGDTNLAIEGQFDLPPLAQLSSEDQVFISAFISCHGSIKEMERFLGVSYPTIKNRLKKLTTSLNLVEIQTEEGAPSPGKVLSRLEEGEIDVEQAIKELER